MIKAYWRDHVTISNQLYRSLRAKKEMTTCTSVKCSTAAPPTDQSQLPYGVRSWTYHYFPFSLYNRDHIHLCPNERMCRRRRFKPPCPRIRTTARPRPCW